MEISVISSLLLDALWLEGNLKDSFKTIRFTVKLFSKKFYLKIQASSAKFRRASLISHAFKTSESLKGSLLRRKLFRVSWTAYWFERGGWKFNLINIVCRIQILIELDNSAVDYGLTSCPLVCKWQLMVRQTPFNRRFIDDSWKTFESYDS